jgi:hypothetical protein
MPYAEKTRVPVTRSRDELDNLLRKKGAQGFAAAWDANGDRVEFLWKGLRIRFLLPRVKGTAKETPEQAERRRWRALVLVVKAKLEAVESGISIFEEEFMAHIVDEATGRTVGEVLIPRIQQAGGKARGLLTDGGEK